MAELIRCKRSGQGSPLAQFQDQVGALWDNYFGRPANLGETTEYTISDYDHPDRENDVLFRAELPGFAPEDIHVELHENVLMIHAVRNQNEGKKGQPCRRLVHAEYSRTMTLPRPVRAEDIQVVYDRGVLELHLPGTSGR